MESKRVTSNFSYVTTMKKKKKQKIAAFKAFSFLKK